MSDSSQELFDAEFLQRLRVLFFKLRNRRRLQRIGAQQTPAAGFSREFKDHRRYTPGDDYRSIDWRLLARLEKLFIRVFEQVQEFHVHVIVDRSRSMIDPYPEKRVLALRLAVALSYLGLISGHTVSLVTLDTEARRELRPLKGQGHIHRLIDHVAQMPFGGQTDLPGAFRRFRPSQRQRGIVFAISDLFGDDPHRAEEAIAEARLWPAETHMIHLVHPRERDPQLEGELRLVDTETEQHRRMWLTQRELEAYRNLFERFLDGVQQTCSRTRIDYVHWPTDQAFEDMFLTLLSRGSALAES